MAFQSGTGKNPKPPGAPAKLKQGTRPAGETYKNDLTKGSLARGGLGPVRRDPITGAEVARTGYGQNNYSGASSAGVEESSKLSDLDITVQDEALDKLVHQGVGYKENDAPQVEVGQERPISDTSFPATVGAVRQQNPDKVFGKAKS
jgi:hypothetical protein